MTSCTSETISANAANFPSAIAWLYSCYAYSFSLTTPASFFPSISTMSSMKAAVGEMAKKY
jgi:hypothetical protein